MMLRQKSKDIWESEGKGRFYNNLSDNILSIVLENLLKFES